jgi:hypothetical protein
LPTAAAVARATAAPSTPAPPGPQASLPPAKIVGVPSPSPTNGPAIAKAQGTLPSPGPKGSSSPGPRAGSSAISRPGPTRPVEVTPTASPAATGGSTTKTGKTTRNLNAFLRSLLPNNPSPVTSKTYGGGYRAVPTTLDPTPPPEVLAKTIYLYQTSGKGTEARTKMWVTSIRKVGPLTFCTGWLVRYPYPATMSTSLGTRLLHPTISTGEAGFKPIIEPSASYICEARSMTPYVPSPAP